jgi:hypothetical protein
MITYEPVGMDMLECFEECFVVEKKSEKCAWLYTQRTSHWDAQGCLHGGKVHDILKLIYIALWDLAVL